MTNYFYKTNEKSLQEILLILDELNKCFNQNIHFSTIILSGAINERLISEKLIGHSKIKDKEGKNIDGVDFFEQHRQILCFENDKQQKRQLIKDVEVEIYGKKLNKNKKLSNGNKINEVEVIFDIDGSFQNKLNLMFEYLKINDKHKDYIKRIHDLRIKYFHPFKITNSDSIEQDVKTAYDTIKELVTSFYDIQ